MCGYDTTIYHDHFHVAAVHYVVVTSVLWMVAVSFAIADFPIINLAVSQLLGFAILLYCCVMRQSVFQSF